MACRITIQHPYIAKPPAKEAQGPGPESHESWRRAFQAALEDPQRQPELIWLRGLLIKGRPIAAEIKIFGTAEHVRPLDVHEAAGDILGVLLGRLFPHQDNAVHCGRCWTLRVKKLVDSKEHLKIDISPVRPWTDNMVFAQVTKMGEMPPPAAVEEAS